MNDTPPSRSIRVLFALPGLHRVSRGAEVAFESVADELARIDGCRVTLIGSGQPMPERAYRFIHVPCTPRERFERWPSLPLFRNEYVYEEFTFARRLGRAYDPDDHDLTVTCSYPFMNWLLRRRRGRRGRLPHVYVTQNGDYPAQAPRGFFRGGREFGYFHCDGLVCTNPDYFDANRSRWPSVLIPNGVDPRRFTPPDPAARSARSHPHAVMVSALIASKRVVEGIRAAAAVPDLRLTVAGDGPERDSVERTGRELMGDRFRRVTLRRDQMPDFYRDADLFLHMSLDEPSANAYIEALATGLPIVTHDRRVTRWTFEDTAVLVDATDLAAVTEAIRLALSRRTPDDVAARRALVESRFAWSAIARRYHAFFLEVLGRFAS